MHTVIFTSGILENSWLVVSAIQSASSIIAADHGAQTALDFGVQPEVVLGDMDSIDAVTQQKLQKEKVQFIPFPQEKDQTDTELAINYAIEKGATAITLLGGIAGDRLDHILANIFLAGISTVQITFINGLQRAFIAKGPTSFTLKGHKNDLLSLIPVNGSVTGIASTGLKWELQQEVLVFGKPRGVSNVFLQENVTVSMKDGVLFVVHTLLS